MNKLLIVGFITTLLCTSCDGPKFNNNEIATTEDTINKTQISVISNIDNNSTDEALNNSEDNTITEIIIGNQIWMNKNLNVDKFRNGELITQAKSTDEWIIAAQNQEPAWCYYNFNPTYGAKHGKLYNWYAVNDTRGIAPQNWHVPSSEEWYELKDTLLNKIYDSSLGIKSKTGWIDNANGTNESGFSAYPSGHCFIGTTEMKFVDMGTCANWWTSSKENSVDRAYVFELYKYGNPNVSESRDFYDGYSVRCLKN